MVSTTPPAVSRRRVLSGVATALTCGLPGCSSDRQAERPDCVVQRARAAVDVEVNDAANTITVTYTTAPHSGVVLHVTMNAVGSDASDTATLASVGDRYTSEQFSDGTRVAVTVEGRWASTEKPAECYDSAVVADRTLTV